MTCFPSQVAPSLSADAYHRRMTGEGLSYQQRQRAKIQCPNCDKELAQSSLKHHLRRAHGLEVTSWLTNEEIAVQHNPQQYNVSFPKTLSSCNCPVPECKGRARTRAGLRLHFMYRHPNDKIRILEEGSAPLPQCPHCGLHVTHLAMNRGHTNTYVCMKGRELLRRRAIAASFRRAKEVVITATGVPLERVTEFKYLGRTLSANNSNWPALYKNLIKARKKWALISRPLLRDGATPRILGMFYKAIVQTVLLYGCETWVITSPIMKILDSFHHKVARRISNKQPHIVNGTWQYPPLGEALDIAGLYSMTTYVRRRQATIIQYIATRPVYTLCQLQHPPPQARDPTTSRLFRWWTQPLLADPANPHPFDQDGSSYDPSTDSERPSTPSTDSGSYFPSSSESNSPSDSVLSDSAYQTPPESETDFSSSESPPSSSSMSSASSYVTAPSCDTP